MNTTGTNISFNTIKELLHSDPAKGADLLISAADESHAPTDLYIQVILHKSKLSRAVKEEEKQKAVTELLKLANAIEKSQAGPSMDVATKSREIRTHFLEKGVSKKIIFECTDVTKVYSSFSLKPTNLQLRLGEITGIVGENANGKTTLLKIIAGELLQDDGTTKYYFDKLPPEKKQWPLIKKRIAYLPQILPGVKGNVLDHLRLVASINGIKGTRNRVETEYIINRLGLAEHQDKTWNKLSGGVQLRFALARILLKKPKLIILDEPLANLDINTQNTFLKDLRDLANSISDPVSVIMSSQHIEEVESVSDIMIVLSKGEIVFKDATAAIGNLRPENTFEIKTALPKSVLKEKLSELPYSKFEHTGFSYIVSLPLDVSLADFQQYLLSHDIPVTYVCDISNSTRKIVLKLNP